MYLTKNIANVTLICGSVDGRQQIRMGGPDFILRGGKNLQYEIWCDFSFWYLQLSRIYQLQSAIHLNKLLEGKIFQFYPRNPFFAFKLLLPVVLITINYTR